MRDEYRLDGEMIRGPRAKALISSPADGAVLRDRVVRASGIAWAGEAEVSRVELSVDQGESWHHAQLAGYGGRGAWRRWDLDLDVPADVSGAVTVLARATDDRGRTQPAQGLEPARVSVGWMGPDHGDIVGAHRVRPAWVQPDVGTDTDQPAGPERGVGDPYR